MNRVLLMSFLAHKLIGKRLSQIFTQFSAFREKKSHMALRSQIDILIFAKALVFQIFCVFSSNLFRACIPRCSVVQALHLALSLSSPLFSRVGLDLGRVAPNAQA